MIDEIIEIDSLTMARLAAKSAADTQAVDIIVLDLRQITDFADFFVICSGVVDVHVKAIYQHIESELRQNGARPKRIEGENVLRWVLMDYVDVVINVFQPDARGFYSLERLWSDAPLVDLGVSV